MFDQNMSFYLFDGIYIDFDYKQNVVQGNAVILSKEFGQYKYSKDIDSMQLNIPSNQLHDRICVSASTLNSAEQYIITYQNKKSTLLNILKTHSSDYPDLNLVIYCDAQNYAFLLAWFFKSMLPNHTLDNLYLFYLHIMRAQLALNYLEKEEYILSKEDFSQIYNNTTESSSDKIEELKKSINIVFKLANISSSGYTIDQLEDMKSILIGQCKKFYQRTFQKTYRKLVENFFYFETSGCLYKKDNKIVWKICDDIEISNTNQITTELTSEIFKNHASFTEFSQNAVEMQIVGQGMSFKKIFNLKEATYNKLNNELSGVFKVDPLHWFFHSNKDLDKFNPVKFIQHAADFNFNSDLFSSNSFAGITSIVSSYVADQIRKFYYSEENHLKEFCLNKIEG